MIIRGNTVGTNMSVDKIAEKIGGTGGGIAPLIVTIDQSTGKASHTVMEMLAKIESGGVVYLRLDGGYWPLTFVDLDFADFTQSIPEDPKEVVWRVWSDETIEKYDNTFATSDQIGDISSALDELHTYAQGLIEGGATE